MRSTLTVLIFRQGLCLQCMFNNAAQLELLLIDLSDISDPKITSPKCILFYKVVGHIFELGITWIVEVGRDWNPIVRLKCEGEKLIVHDDNAREVNALENPKILDVNSFR